MAWVKNNIFSTRHYWYSPTSWRVVARGFWRLLAVARLQKRYTRLHQKPPLGVSRLAQSPKFAWWFVYKEGDPSPSKSKSHICEICWLQREVTAFTLKANGRLSWIVNDHPGVLYSPCSPGRHSVVHLTSTHTHAPAAHHDWWIETGFKAMLECCSSLGLC